MVHAPAAFPPATRNSTRVYALFTEFNGILITRPTIRKLRSHPIMKWNEIIQIVLFFGLGIALTPPVGRFMFKIYTGQKTWLHPIFSPIEKLVYKLTGVNPEEEMTWVHYFWAVLMFATVGFVADMAIFMTQQWLPLNPQGLPNCSWHLAFMQAWSFICNADWQSYAGETTMSNFSQVFAIMVHQFLSGASGLAVLVAVGPRAQTRLGENGREFLGRIPDARPDLFCHVHCPSCGRSRSPGRASRRHGRPLPECQLDGALHHSSAEDGRQRKQRHHQYPIGVVAAKARRQRPARHVQRRARDGGCPASRCQRPADHDQCGGDGGRAGGHATNSRRPGSFT